MKIKLLKFALCVLATILVHKANAQTYNISADVLKFEYECYACGKKDVYHFYNGQSIKTIKTNCPNYKTDSVVNAVVREFLQEKCMRLNNEAENPGITQNSSSTLSGFQVFGAILFDRPDLTTAGRCSRNLNSSDHDVNFNINGKTTPLNIYISKVEFDDKIKHQKEYYKRELEQSKANAVKRAELQQKQEAEDNKKAEFAVKFNKTFSKITEGIKMSKAKDSAGIDMVQEGFAELIELGGGPSDIDLTKQYTNADGFKWTFRGITEDLALCYLYCGKYTRCIQDVTVLSENFDPQGNGLKVLLGMAYLMNCQGTKATVIWQNAKASATYPCSLYQDIDNLIGAMREYHPDLKCIKTLKTLPILALLKCP